VETEIKHMNKNNLSMYVLKFKSKLRNFTGKIKGVRKFNIFLKLNLQIALKIRKNTDGYIYV
jgi:hypothetical protein